MCKGHMKHNPKQRPEPPNPNKNKFNTSLVFCVWLFASGHGAAVWALESDSSQPISIDSNTATYDENTQTSTYIGNVISIQGSIHVNSDKLVAYQKDGEVDKLVFTGNGNRAKFRQTPDGGGDDVTGEAFVGEYYPKKNLLILQNQAVVVQGNATYASNLIEYDLKSSLVKAGEKSSDSKRVHVILRPKDKPKETDGCKDGCGAGAQPGQAQTEAASPQSQPKQANP